MLDKAPEVQAWHATLTLKEQIAWASPDKIMRKCPVFNQPADPKPPQPMIRHELGPERLQVSELQARVAELEEELAGARTAEVSGHVVVAQPGLEDIRNAYAETLLRLPRSERLREMRARAEKVLGIGTLGSRRRMSRATEAAAQTTEVESASEFHVEREGEPEEATPGHRSVATIVSDTIHTAGVKVASSDASASPRQLNPPATATDGGRACSHWGLCPTFAVICKFEPSRAGAFRPNSLSILDRGCPNGGRYRSDRGLRPATLMPSANLNTTS